MLQYGRHCHSSLEQVNDTAIYFRAAKINLASKMTQTGTLPTSFEDFPARNLLKAETGDADDLLRPYVDEVHLWLMPTDLPPLPLERLANLLSPAETARANRFHFPLHRTRYMAAHGFLRLVLSTCGAGNARDLEFVTGPQGKPSLLSPAGSAPLLHFNLSHSGAWALLATATSGGIGADIEEIRAFDDFQSMARNTFSPPETANLLSLPSDRQLDGFFACWARKEALIKADGRGLGVPLDHFEVNVDPGQPACLHRAEEDATPLQQFEIHDLPAIQGYRATAAVPKEICRFRFFRIT
ncbi:MAG: 4'-phosphopantetheinyl transferase superfamily protein [Alphaproteobacteria bacterium]|nr:4'-phosphopantetheinyl transferase [Hyphomonas sp.]MBR9805910.1 4'-phosphopantetheinyl transferase superfamily protein [Alphaproteobacteria bacterium]|tara:strand:- start:888 stop:1781 length:894 start_codon:yes stop_codon:yes gene_type:complete